MANDEVGRWLAESEHQLAHGDPEGAIKSALAAWRIDPGSAQACAQLSLGFWRLGKHADAAMMLDAARSRGGGPLADDMELRIAHARGDHGRVLALAPASIARHPDDAELHMLWCQALVLGKQAAPAGEATRALVRIAPRSRVAWSLRGSALALAGEFAAAGDAVEHALRCPDDDPAVELALREALVLHRLAAGDPERARAAGAAAVQAAPHMGRAWHLLAIAHEALHSDVALACAAVARGLMPGDAALDEAARRLLATATPDQRERHAEFRARAATATAGELRALVDELVVD